MMRRRKYVPFGFFLALFFCACTFLNLPADYIGFDGPRDGVGEVVPGAEVPGVDVPSADPPGVDPPGADPPGVPATNEPVPDVPIDWEPETKPRRPSDPQPQPARGSAHPVQALVTEAEREFEAVRARQSRTLADAVGEYRRRYGMPPPPNFDKWFAFAQDRRVQLVDEFDMIDDMLRPFWGLKPKTIRDRVREALGFDNFLIGVMVRDGHVMRVNGGPDWQRDATKGMMAKFVRYLPDMDLAFNMHDEPRVVVPHDDLERLVRAAVEVKVAMANAAGAKTAERAETTETTKMPPVTNALTNAFTKPASAIAGHIFEETSVTRFNIFSHQPTWTESRMSCPVDSPARALDDDDGGGAAADDISRYGISDLGFVYNVTAMSDICLSPSLRNAFGFFDRPNAYNVVHDLVPVFSQSKVSSYADILYPSPWYWYGKVEYDPRSDVAWDEKADRLYWRGSTTGGFSRNGGWRRQHRQNFVRKANAPGRVRILQAAENRGDGDPGSDSSSDSGTDSVADGPRWVPAEAPRGDFADLIDVHFSHIGQCDPGDCAAQQQFFGIKDHADQQDAWRYKFLLDIDGNAFSGRFYAFLRSRSLVFKVAYFREWHLEWLRPWAHYVPLSLLGDDWLESVRFLRGGGGRGGDEERGQTPEERAQKPLAKDEGARVAERIAEQSQDWAGKVLRREDMETWFFRLLLEYGRVVDDNRESIGFSMAPE